MLHNIRVCQNFVKGVKILRIHFTQEQSLCLDHRFLLLIENKTVFDFDLPISNFGVKGICPDITLGRIQMKFSNVRKHRLDFLHQKRSVTFSVVNAVNENSANG